MDQYSIDALREQVVADFSHLIDGKHVGASSGETMEILSPVNGNALCAALC